MTNLLARILLAIMLLPLAVVLYVAILFLFMTNRGGRAMEDTAFFLATVVTAAFVAIYWLRLWRNSVNWTSRRTLRTALSGVGCIVTGVIAAAVLSETASIHEMSFFFFVCGLVAVVSWLPITVVLWKETPLERADRLRQAASDVLFCPRCGYNMTGLREARCPECGAQYTINQLFSAQPRTEIADAAAPSEERQNSSEL